MAQEFIAWLLATQYNKSVLQTQEWDMCPKAKQIPVLGLLRAVGGNPGKGGQPKLDRPGAGNHY